MLKFWSISDTHGQHESLIVPQGIDGIFHTGDGGTYKNPEKCKRDLDACLRWLDSIPVKHKIYVPGNHDTAMEKGLINPSDYPSVTILVHDFVEIEGIKIFGSPWTPWFYDWAYNATDEQLQTLWNEIPEDCDVVLTHGPVKNILDRCADGKRAGCEFLLKRLLEVKPKFHVCGHIHEEGGKRFVFNKTTFVNASVLNLSYTLVNNGTIIKV